MAAFLENRREKGCKAATLNKYRHDLAQLYRFLPGDKFIWRNTLPEWRRQMEGEGFCTRTLSARISAVNSFLDYMGRRDLQLSRLPRGKAGPLAHLSTTATVHFSSLQHFDHPALFYDT